MAKARAGASVNAIRRKAISFCADNNYHWDQCPSNKTLIEAIATIKQLSIPLTKDIGFIASLLDDYVCTKVKTPVKAKKSRGGPSASRNAPAYKQLRHTYLKKRLDSTVFFVTQEWRELRYQVLLKYKAACQCCGRTYKEHGVVIHVDHIKPRSLRPDLELDIENLQVLCEDCNIGKSNKDETDWRVVQRSRRTTPITPSKGV